ncbi:unnamed protein product [Arabidopsis halleri]
MRDPEATSHLWFNMNLPGAQGIPNPDELLFSEEYKKFARSSFETNALANDLFAWCDRQLKRKYGDRDNFELLNSVYGKEKREHEELKKKFNLLSEKSETHSAEADVAFSMDHEEKELDRLRNDRFVKVSRNTQKAQARLDKAKDYIKEQEQVVQPRMDAMNQAKGAQEIIAELSDTDLNMFPDQLGFGLTRLDSEVVPVSNQHGSNSELVSRSDLRCVIVEEC